jgi:hypothetical protein
VALSVDSILPAYIPSGINRRRQEKSASYTPSGTETRRKRKVRKMIDFKPALIRHSLDLRASTDRALEHCAKIHGISKRKLAMKLLEDAIFKESQSHNPANER